MRLVCQLGLAALLISFILLSACASVHNSPEAKTVEGETVDGLNVSAIQVNDSGEEPFLLLTVTFENKSDKWIRVASVDTPMSEEVASKISIVVGNDLIDWGKAQAAKKELNEHNEKMTQLGLAVVGAAVAVGSAANGNQNGAAAGLATMGVAQGWAAGSAISKARANAMNAKWVPDDHLLAPFSIPGRGFMRKWILYNVPVGVRFKELPVKVTMVDGKVTTLNMKVGYGNK